MKPTHFWSRVSFYDWYSYLTHHEQWIFTCIIAFITVSLLLLLTVLSSRSYKLYIGKKVQKRHKVLASFLSTYLFDDNKTGQIYGLLNKYYLQNNLGRRVLLAEVVKLNKSFVGETAEKLQELYRQTGLVQDSYRKLRRSEWHRKAQGVHELAFMQIQEAIPVIAPLARHPNRYLRIEAQHALVKLAAPQPLAFLTEYPYLLSDWEQIRLAGALQSCTASQVPDFTPWLRESNASVVLFSLKMIKYFNQYQAEDELLKLLEHPNLAIKRAAIEAVREMEMETALPLLLAAFVQEEESIQLAIIQTVAALGSAEYLPFLRPLYQMNSYPLAMAAAQAILQLSKLGEAPLAETPDGAFTPLQEKIRLHMLDERLHHA